MGVFGSIGVVFVDLFVSDFKFADRITTDVGEAAFTGLVIGALKEDAVGVSVADA